MFSSHRCAADDAARVLNAIMGRLLHVFDLASVGADGVHRDELDKKWDWDVFAICQGTGLGGSFEHVTRSESQFCKASQPDHRYLYTLVQCYRMISERKA